VTRVGDWGVSWSGAPSVGALGPEELGAPTAHVAGLLMWLGRDVNGATAKGSRLLLLLKVSVTTRVGPLRRDDWAAT
jgi:hypothetical protein